MQVFTDDPRHETTRQRLSTLLPEAALVDPVSRGLYATDASVYEFLPIAVVVPRHEADIAATLKVAREMKVPVTPRAGGTSLAGQTANNAIILDVSKHLNRLLEVNVAERWVRVQPGLVRDELNAVIAPHGLEFGPETATSNRANIAGMIGNNSSGMHSVRYGRTLEHVLELKVMLANGDIIHARPRARAEIDALAQGDSPEGIVWRGLAPLLDSNRELIRERFPKVIRRVGGYALDEFAHDGEWNLAKLFCGSEGTLGVILEAKLNLVPIPPVTGIVAVHYHELIAGLRSTTEILKFQPLGIELLDGAMLRLSRGNPSTEPHCFFIEGEPGAILFTELDADTPEELARKMDALEAHLRGLGHGYHYPRMTTKQDVLHVMELRKKGLGVSLSVPGDTKPVSWIEDACVPPEHLADYTRRVLAAATSKGLDTVIYGHASVGVLHIKPALNLKNADHLRKMAELSHEAMLLCKEYGGSWSGEHGDGVARGAQNREFWGEEMYGVFLDVKNQFDPLGILNPNRIVNAPPVNENLRFGLNYKVDAPKTFFRFGECGGFAPAVEMCNGVGACRKTLGGTMCPSYMATRDEQDTTRGRANALRLAMTGRFGPNGLVSERVHEVLDLCLECKACKSECPSNVDMAKMKSEHLAHYHAAHGATLRDRVFAEAPTSGRLASGLLAPLVNAVNGIPIVQRMMKRVLRIAEGRTMPRFARQTLQGWFAERGGCRTKGREVVLFGDCWTSYYETEPGRAAVRLLEAFGYHVRVATGLCCQRTRISKGFLDEARRDGAKTVAALRTWAREGTPILGIEPSCVSSLTDDLPDLVPNVEDARLVAGVAMPVEAFLAREVAEGRVAMPRVHKAASAYLVHGHCHQKALFSTSPARTLLAKCATDAGAPRVTEVDSGCCGMAGSFGYEAEHYELSQRIGERRLMPAVRETSADTVVIANGFSCRHQVKDFSGRRAVHIVEALADALTEPEPRDA